MKVPAKDLPLCELLANTDSNLDRGLVRKMRLAFSLTYGWEQCIV